MREYILPALKLLGLLLTAFFGLAALFRGKGESPEQTRRDRRWGIAAIFVSVAIAASAELIDTIFKKQEATTAAVRAAESARQTQTIINDLDRSLHLLFPIEIHTVFGAELSHPSLAGFRQRLINAVPADKESSWPKLDPSTKLFPDPNREGAAYALLNVAPQVRVFLVRKPANPAASFANEEPDLSFSLKTTNGPPPALDRVKSSSVKATMTSYGYSETGRITMHFPYETINASDCYSNGQIISPSDLLGARMTIQISPYFGLRNVEDETVGPALSNAIELEWIDIELPGNREIQLHPKDFERSKYKNDNLFIFTFPKTKEEMEKLFLP